MVRAGPRAGRGGELQVSEVRSRHLPSREKTKSLAWRRSGPGLGPWLQLSCTPSSWMSWVSSCSCAPEQKSMSVRGRAGAGGGGPHQVVLPQTTEAM